MTRRLPRQCGPSLLCVLLVLSGPAGAQGGFLAQFHFEELGFRFHPGGLGTSAGTGSGLQVTAQNLTVEGNKSKEMRHCIDGFGRPQCSYPFGVGNRDGTVAEEEVRSFQDLALIGLDGVEKVERLSDMLQQNVTVDAVRGDRPRTADLDLRGAEGDVNSTERILLDVVIEVGYGNDKGARRHEIRAGELALAPEGFAFQRARWTVASDKPWQFRPADTQPASAQAFVAPTGWTSNQSEFETATGEGLVLVAERTDAPAARGGALWWWIGGGLVLAALVALAVFAARRR